MSYETTTKTERNKFIIAHIASGKTNKEVQSLLIDAGYDKIDMTRIWKIWKRSDLYVSKKKKLQSCVFCKSGKTNSELCSIVRNFKVVGKVCDTCLEKGLQPSNE